MQNHFYFLNIPKKNSIAILNIDNRYSHFFFQICEKKKLRILDYGKRGKFLKLSTLKRKMMDMNIEFF